MELTTKGQRTRERIVAEAAAIFNQRGYEGTSMKDLMDATGLEKGGLYRHFASKEDLAVEAFRHAWHEATGARMRDVESVHGSIEKLRYIVERFVSVRSPIPGGCPLMNMAVECDDGNPMLRALAHEALREWQDRIIAVVNAGIAAREIRKNVDARSVANRMIATLEGALMISRLERNRDALEDARKTLAAELDGITRIPAQNR